MRITVYTECTACACHRAPAGAPRPWVHPTCWPTAAPRLWARSLPSSTLLSLTPATNQSPHLTPSWRLLLLIENSRCLPFLFSLIHTSRCHRAPVRRGPGCTQPAGPQRHDSGFTPGPLLCPRLSPTHPSNCHAHPPSTGTYTPLLVQNSRSLPISFSLPHRPLPPRACAPRPWLRPTCWPTAP